MEWIFRLDGQVAFFAGSAAELWATARPLASLGATVVLNGHSDVTRMQQRAEELHTLGWRAEFCRPLKKDPDYSESRRAHVMLRRFPYHGYVG